jgi:hypothetical protein
MVKERLATLSTSYLNNAISSENPIILRSIEEYNRYAGGRVISIPTLLDTFIEHSE